MKPGNLCRKYQQTKNFTGVRVLGSEKHELLRQVPKSLVDVFKIGSTAPGRHLMLLDRTLLLHW